MASKAKRGCEVEVVSWDMVTVMEKMRSVERERGQTLSKHKWTDLMGMLRQYAAAIEYCQGKEYEWNQIYLQSAKVCYKP